MYPSRAAPKSSAPLIIDACLLFNEIDLLEIRVGELWDAVDRFLIVESDRTFAGQPKPFFFETHRARFERFAEKITYIKHQAGGPTRTGRARVAENERFHAEAAQRDAIGTALGELGLQDDDIVLLCDVDEIPRAATIMSLHGRLSRKDFSIFLLRNLRGYINSQSSRALNGTTFAGPVACRWRTMRRIGAQRVRTGEQRSGHVIERRSSNWDYVEDGGWHISSVGGAEAFWVKAQNFAHVHDPYQVVAVPDADQPVEVFEAALTRDDCVKIQAKFLDSGGDSNFARLEFDEFHIQQDIPRYLLENKQRFRRFFYFTDIG